jgi:serine/threonine protein kinase
MEKYTKSEKLGEGTYGVVYRAVDKSSGEVVALKQMRLDHEDEGIPVVALREVALLRNLFHPNIVRLTDILSLKGSLTLVTEYLDFDLRNYLDQLRAGLPAALLKSYAFQLCYLHSNRIMHRDMKPQNLLINKDGFLKICDFGLTCCR